MMHRFEEEDELLYNSQCQDVYVCVSRVIFFSQVSKINSCGMQEMKTNLEGRGWGQSQM